MTEKTAKTRAARGEIEIEAPIEAVWKALTDARELERWFPLEARVEPGAGGAIWMSWRNEYEGEQEILAWDPPRHLKTSWRMHANDQPPQATDYRLESKGGRTIVRVVTSGFPTDASWDEWVQGTVDGWAFELRSLKEYLERHAGEDREVVYLRRRVTLSPEEIWSRLAEPGALGGARPLGGEPFLETPPRQWAAVAEDLDGALVRAGSDPAGEPGAGERDVTLWLQAWGDARAGLPALREEWSRLIERLYPEGKPV